MRNIVINLTAICFFAIGSLIGFVACDQSVDEPVVNYQQTDSLRSLVSMRAATATPGWQEGGYDAYVAGQFNILSPDKKASDRYVFEVTAYDGLFNEVWIKYYTPSGQPFYERMNRSGSTFRVDHQFKGTGKYSYAFFVRNSSSYPRISSPGLSVDITVSVFSAVNNYPWKIGQTDTWGYYTYYCTSWVAWKVSEMWEGADFYRGLGYAHDWKKNLEAKGYTADSNPQPGDIAWWKNLSNCINPNTNEPCGHVAFVHVVKPNGDIEISEYNGTKSRAHSYRTISKRGSKSYPHAFIHVQRKR